MFNHLVCASLQEEENPQENPKNISGMFEDSNDIWHTVDECKAIPS